MTTIIQMPVEQFWIEIADADGDWPGSEIDWDTWEEIAASEKWDEEWPTLTPEEITQYDLIDYREDEIVPQEGFIPATADLTKNSNYWAVEEQRKVFPNIEFNDEGVALYRNYYPQARSSAMFDGYFYYIVRTADERIYFHNGTFQHISAMTSPDLFGFAQAEMAKIMIDKLEGQENA